MSLFQKRLSQVLGRGNLRVSDLARWFEAPHSTVRGWVEDGREPGGGPIDNANIEFALIKLEQLVTRRILPLPRCSPQERIQRLAALR